MVGNESKNTSPRMNEGTGNCGKHCATMPTSSDGPLGDDLWRQTMSTTRKRQKERENEKKKGGGQQRKAAAHKFIYHNSGGGGGGGIALHISRAANANVGHLGEKITSPGARG